MRRSLTLAAALCMCALVAGCTGMVISGAECQGDERGARFLSDWEQTGDAEGALERLNQHR